MKRILPLTFLLFSFCIKAQQSELFDETWYLTKLNMGGEDFVTPSSDTSSMPPFEETISLDYDTEINQVGMSTNACNGFFIDMIELDDIGFTVMGVSVTLMDCEFPLYDAHDGRYYSFFGGGADEDFPWAGFQYEIIENPDDSKVLKITNPDGDIAYYLNEKMSVKDHFNLDKFQVVISQKNLIIKGIEVAQYAIYGLDGKMILSLKSKNNQIPVNHLSKGIYILKVWDQNQKIFTKKVNIN